MIVHFFSQVAATLGWLMRKPRVLFVQLPIPPAGPSPIVGNVPLAAGYLMLHARNQGLEESYEFQILPPRIANEVSDLGIVEAILKADPWMVGFTCYLWNIDRTLWIAERLKRVRPDLLIVLGGPEITIDNDWVYQSGFCNYAVVGEGEQTFVALLQALKGGKDVGEIIPGLWRATDPRPALFRKPLPNLNDISSPYLAGILDAADEKLLLLETIRGCIFKCKFCYYPKSYDGLYFVSEEKVIANLRHARERGATEVVLLDPTLNQRKDFDDFLRLLHRENPDHQFRYFGELRSEGIKPETAKLLRDANFTEVEIGLQSIDAQAQTLMDRKNNLKAFERGVQGMLDAGLQVKVDLIIGLPGDTVSSIRRSFDYLANSGLYSTVQVFNLAILPGTAFRQEANMLGLEFQPRPPYYVLETPTLKLEDLYAMMEEAEEVFESEWDPFPEPKLNFPKVKPIEFQDQQLSPVEIAWVELDREKSDSSEPFSLPSPSIRSQAFTIWFRGNEFHTYRTRMIRTVEQILADNPHSTLQVVIEPTAGAHQLAPTLAASLLEVSFQSPNYLDRYYSLHPRGSIGSKRVLLLLDGKERSSLNEDWLEAISDSASIVYRGQVQEEDLEAFEMIGLW